MIKIEMKAPTKPQGLPHLPELKPYRCVSVPTAHIMNLKDMVEVGDIIFKFDYNVIYNCTKSCVVRTSPRGMDETTYAKADDVKSIVLYNDPD